MTVLLDHLILPVNDRDQSLDFYTRILGLAHAGERDPFTLLRVGPDCLIQLAPWGTKGGGHLAFSLSPEAFHAAFEGIREAGIEYGDAFDAVGNQQGPGRAEGARGASRSLYCLDPNKHLIELLYYEA